MFLLPIGLNNFMKKQFLSLFISLLFIFSVSAQTKEARKIDEFGKIPCGDFDSRMDGHYQDYKNSLNSKIYVIFYEEQNHLTFTDKREEIIKNPRRGNALNRAKEIPLYLKTIYKMPKDKVVLLNGGFRKDFELEIWIVPKNAELPKSSPTVDEKDVKFDEGKPIRTRNCARAYDGYK